MHIRIDRYGMHRYATVVGRACGRGGREREVVFRLGRCDDRDRQRVMSEAVQDYGPLERARIVIEEVEDVSGRVQGRGFFRKFRRFR